MRLKTLAILIVMAVGTRSVSAQQTAAAQSLQPNPQAVRNYGHLPLTFEANQGQAAGQVKFLSRGQGYTTFLTAGGMVLNLRASRVEPASNRNSQAASSQPPASATLQFSLIGANRNPQVVGEDPQPGHVNYFIGKDPSKWYTNLPTYAKVRYKNVYQGIDLIYYGNHQQLEYDFAVAPGADPRQIQFEIKGASQMALGEQGDLVLNVNGAKLHFQSPVVYQESNGTRVPVSGGYEMKDSSHIGFAVANFDARKPLVIDPVLVYSTYLGGSGADQPTGIAIDNSGNVYVAGYTNSADFPMATLGSLPPNTDHVFVAKLDSTGSNLIYADYIGGNSDDYGVALALDSANEVYVTGSTQSSNFPVVNAYQSQQPGPYTGFLTRVSADGSALIYSTYLGGNNYDQPAGVAIDGSGEVLVAGYTQSTNFPVANAYQSTALANQGGNYGTYGFLTKFSADDSSLVYSTYFAGNSNVEEGGCCWVSPFNTINSVAADANGNAYVTGTTNTYNFPVTSGSYSTTNTTAQNANIAFVSKFNSAGGLDYSTYFFDPSGYTVSTAAIAVDGSGSAYITGSAYSDTTFPVTSTSICNPGTDGSACSYGFVTKFNAAASALSYSTFLGPNNDATPQAIALDANDDAYVFASASSSSFAEVNGIEPYDSQDDVLLVEIDPTGSNQLFATYMGGSGDDEPAGIAVDGDGNMYIVGSTDSSDLPTTQGAFQTVTGGNTDAFIAKIGPASAPAVSLIPNSLQFSAIAVSSTSSAQTVLLRNMGSSALSISSLTASGDFAQTNDCGSSVPAAGSCTISVTFTPTAQGSRSGSIAVEDDAAGSPHNVALYGVGEDGSGGSPAPNAAVAPTTLTFSNVPVGHSSLSQSVTLTNAGNASMSIAGLQITGDFSQTNTCSTSLAAGANCTISVVFTPTAEGTRTGTLTINDNAQGSPQTVSLTGTGTAGTLVLGSNTLTFSSVQVGLSASQAVTLSNTGNGPVSINGLQISGDYAQINNCPSPISGGASCSITVVFTPTATGTRTGTLTVTSGAQATQQTVSLSGIGIQADLVLSSTALAFANMPLGTPSASQALTLKNTGTASLSLSNLQVTGDYKQTNNCTATLAAGSSCTVNVVFTPTATGTRTGSLTITDSLGTPQTVTLSGTGVDFSLSSSSTDNTIQPGASATYTLTASAVGGSFSNAVDLSCSGLPAQATCSFSPSSVTPGASKATVTLTISTTDSIAENTPAIPAHQKPISTLWMQVQGLGVVGMVLANGKKRSKKAAILILLVLLVLGMLFMSGCAGGTGIAPQTQQTPQSFTITVTGVSGSLQHSVPVTLTVQ
jgi:Beta-propeller repeat/Abnormal spindle-like microcephaly-assoc'd, ASPM-SPD-2-Hydin